MLKLYKPQQLLVSAFLITFVFGAYTSVLAQWEGWGYRRTIEVSNPGGTELTDFQVKIDLSNLTPAFNFANAKSDGSDIRVADSDEVTKIPFWIEKWNPSVDSAEIWVNVPIIPVGGTNIYLYYGNFSPIISEDPVETPPIGPYTKATGNPIVPIGDPQAGVQLCAENIVYDEVTGHYWMVFANYRSGQSIGLVWSDDPTNPAAWNWYSGSVIPLANAPHIMEYNNTWYIFYADRTTPSPWSIYVASSSNVNGPYTIIGPALAPGASGSWESYRVDEPYVFQRNDGKWILTYMAETGLTDEQVGYAEADNILGPYTKFGGNPCIPFGPPGSYDAGTVADPWVYEYHGVYYIGYTVSPTSSSPWQTAAATTTDWQTFTKLGVIVPRGDEFNTFRGAVTLIGDEYVFSYTGGPSSGQYRLCVATQPVYQVPPSTINEGDLVFDFFDGFDGTSLDLNKWTFTGGTLTQTTVGSGLLTMTTAASPNNNVKINGNTQFGMGYIGETRGRHPNEGTTNLIMEVGFVNHPSDWLNNIRICDDFPYTGFWQYNAQAGSAQPIVDMDQASDNGWHIFSLYRQSPGTAGFQIDNNPVEIVTSNVPTINLRPFLMSYSSSSTSNQFIVDWTRVRKWVEVDPIATVLDEEDNPLPVELSSFSASIIGSKIKLSWRTETEVNNYGFEIERASFSPVQGWKEIGFVQGNGNSNSPKYYSFEDENLTTGKYSYRLKQIDTDGQFEYSKVIEIDLDSPMRYELTQNYPNPFNPTTTIQFSMREAGEVKLVVYNLLGEQVALLVNENKEVGVHTINFNASELNSGMYIYKLESGSFIQTRKMILLK